jgi:uncharacterized protein (TIGR03437 family)
MTKRAFLLGLAILGVAQAQTYNNATLNAKYYFRELYFVTDGTGNPTDVRSANGAILFDGKGGYTVIATQNAGIGNSSPLSVNGTYAVSSNAAVAITDPLKTSLSLNARFTSEAVFGSSSDATDNTFDFFIAIPEPAGGYNLKSLSGNYFISTFEITNASASAVRSALMLSVQPDGKGNIPGFNINGHAANINGGNPYVGFNQGSTYTVNSDGSGAINFGNLDQTQFVSGTKPIFISKSGNIFIGGSTDGGAEDIVIGIKAMPTTPPPSNAWFSGGYFTAGLRLQVDPTGPTSSCYTGGLNSNGTVALFTRRLRQAAVPSTFSFTGSQTYSVGLDGSALAGDYVMGLGAGGLFVQTEYSPSDTTGYEIGFGAVYPAFSGTGVFINPYAIVNAASNAPGGAPLSPGEFVTAFGANLASGTVQAGAPYPLTLGGVTVTVNNISAPIYLVSKGQVNFLVPYAVTGSTANVVIKNSTGTSNTVTLPLATTSPGIYSADLSGAGYGIILHADYSLVTTSSPAKRGETVLVYLTGLGAVSPAVADGVAAPSVPPLSMVSLNAQQLQVYMNGQPAAVQFAGLAPGFPGLYQINVTIPTNLNSIGQVDIAINTPDAFHDQVFINVQ